MGCCKSKSKTKVPATDAHSSAEHVFPPPSYDKASAEERTKLRSHVIASIQNKQIVFAPMKSELIGDDMALLGSLVSDLKCYSELVVKVVGYTCGQKKLEKLVNSRLDVVKAQIETLGFGNHPIEVAVVREKPQKVPGMDGGIKPGSARIFLSQGTEIPPDVRLARITEMGMITFDDLASLTADGKAAVHDVFCALRDSASGCYIDVYAADVKVAQQQGDQVSTELHSLGLTNLLELRAQVSSQDLPVGVTFTLDPNAGQPKVDPTPAPDPLEARTPQATPRKEGDDLVIAVAVPQKPCSLFCCVSASPPGGQEEQVSSIPVADEVQSS